MMLLKLLVLFYLVLTCESNATKAATCKAPSGCPTMKDGSKEGTGDFVITFTQNDDAKTAATKYEAGKTYLVSLTRGGDNKKFKGFTLQANEKAGADGRGTNYVGEFKSDPLPANTQMDCGGDGGDGAAKAAVSHKETEYDATTGEFQWVAPAAADAKTVYFNAIGVESLSAWYGAKNDIMLKVEVQQAAAETVDCAATDLQDETKCKAESECKWEGGKCAKAAAADADANKDVTVDCTVDDLKEEAKCTAKTECKWDADGKKCMKKAEEAAAKPKCGDKTTKADCEALKDPVCVFNEQSKCVTKASVDCPKVTVEADCKSENGCKWDETCKENVVQVESTNGATIATSTIALLSVLVAFKLW